MEQKNDEYRQLIQKENDNCAAELVSETEAQKSQLEQVVEDLSQQEQSMSKELDTLAMEFKDAEAKQMASRAGNKLETLK